MTDKITAEGAPRGPAGSKKNHALIMVWIIVWMATFVAVDKGAENDWFASGTISMLAVGINAVFGLLVITTYMKFLKELDEMQRKIQLSALALGMGVGLVGTVSYSLLVSGGHVAQPDLAVIIMMLGAGYMAGLLIGRSRYS